PLSITTTIGFDLVGVHGRLTLHNPLTSEPLASVDFEAGELRINAIAMDRIKQDWFYDVVVAAVMVECVVEGRRNRGRYANPVDLVLSQRGTEAAGKRRSGISGSNYGSIQSRTRASAPLPSRRSGERRSGERRHYSNTAAASGSRHHSGKSIS